MRHTPAAWQDSAMVLDIIHLDLIWNRTVRQKVWVLEQIDNVREQVHMGKILRKVLLGSRIIVLSG